MYLSVLMIDHNVMRLDVSVHDALAVAEIQCLEELVDVVAHIKVVKLGVQASEVGVVHIFEDERWRLALDTAPRGIISKTMAMQIATQSTRARESAREMRT